MGRTIKSCTVTWTPQGDPARILGWNIVLNGSSTDPYATPIYKQLFVPKPAGTDYSWIGQSRSLEIRHVIVDGGSSIYAWVQQVYRDGDSEWLSSAGALAADDGIASAGDLIGGTDAAVVGSNTNETTQHLTYYVDYYNGNDSYSGLTQTAPLKTIQEAINRLPRFIVHNVTIAILDGSSQLQHRETVYIQRLLGTGDVIIKKDSSVQLSYAVYNENAFCFHISGCTAHIRFQDIIFKADALAYSGPISTVYASNNPGVVEVSNCSFDVTPVYAGQTYNLTGVFAIHSRVNVVNCSPVDPNDLLTYGLKASAGGVITYAYLDPIGYTNLQAYSGGVILAGGIYP